MIHFAPSVTSRNGNEPRPGSNGEAPASVELARLARNRRRMRLVRFILAESLAVTVLAGSVMAGLSERFAAESLTAVFRVVPILAAAVATILPILFFGH